MNTRGRSFFLIVGLVLIGFQALFGCMPLQPISTPGKSPPDRLTPVSDSKAIHLLYQQVNDWNGVPYKFGGLSKRGVDCSGFVLETFRTKFQIKLPRNTHQQSRTGKAVLRSDLRAGDLVFFRLGYNLRHVGIYLENDRFAHASTSKGVTLSNLSDTYWSKRYWKARRILGKR